MAGAFQTEAKIPIAREPHNPVTWVAKFLIAQGHIPCDLGEEYYFTNVQFGLLDRITQLQSYFYKSFYNIILSIIFFNLFTLYDFIFL
jgi:hypothetical protein